jgi:Lrp/AsnC family transcriptional regulator, regulator for asnA, asnC and gidA
MADRPAPKKEPARTGSIPVDLDATDREIIRILQSDGRMSNTDIARRIGVTETTIRKRLAALIEGDYVNIVAVPTPKLAGLTVSAILGISVELRSLSAVAQALVELPEVRYCGISTGRYDLMVEAFFADHEHLVGFVTNVLGRMDGLTNVETSLILKIEKFSYEWEIP